MNLADALAFHDAHESQSKYQAQQPAEAPRWLSSPVLSDCHYGVARDVVFSQWGMVRHDPQQGQSYSVCFPDAVMHYGLSAHNYRFAKRSSAQAELMIDLIDEEVFPESARFSGKVRVNQTSGCNDSELLNETIFVSRWDVSVRPAPSVNCIVVS